VAVAASRELKHETCLMCCGTANAPRDGQKNPKCFYFYLSVTHWPEVREKKKRKKFVIFALLALHAPFWGWTIN
jgi:hypothetical protein